MSKLKQILFVLLTMAVSVVLLGHEIIPHHHHDGNLPCFAMNHSDSHKTHQPQQENGTCTLEQVIIAPGNINDNSFHLIQNYPTDILQAPFLPVFYNLSIPERIISVREPLYLITYHSITAAHSLGLRAPPTV